MTSYVESCARNFKIITESMEKNPFLQTLVVNSEEFRLFFSCQRRTGRDWRPQDEFKESGAQGKLVAVKKRLLVICQRCREGKLFEQKFWIIAKGYIGKTKLLAQ